MKELAEITDLELRKKLRKRNKLRKKRSRKAHGLGPRKKGMGVRIGDRDEAEKVRRGYVEAGSYVRRDGSEKLIGVDWAKRKMELVMRCGGQCEWVDSKCSENQVGSVRCSAIATEPHHLMKRSVRRDDRLSNLQGLCHLHHVLLDPRKIRSGKVGA